MSDDPNASCVYATLRLWGKQLDPDKVTSSLKITPYLAHKVGDRRGKSGTWPHGYWGLTSQDRIVSTNLAVHIEWLLDQIEPAKPEFMAIITEDIHADIFCFWESLTGQGGPSFEPALLRRLVDLNL